MKKILDSKCMAIVVCLFSLSLIPLSFLSGYECFAQKTFHSDPELLNEMRLEFSLHSAKVSLFKFEAVQSRYEKTVNFYLIEARSKRDIANNYLMEAESCVKLLPDIDLKQKIRTLITSSIGSIAIADPRQKLLAVGLALIADLVNDLGIGTYENFSELRKDLAMGASYLEESNYYYRLALAAPIYTENWSDNVNEYGGYIENAIHYLILLDMFTTTLTKPTDGIPVSSYIFTIREKILSEFVEHGKIVNVHSEKVEAVRENLPEIMADCDPSDRSLATEMDRILNEIRWYLRGAERKLGLI